MFNIIITGPAEQLLVYMPLKLAGNDGAVFSQMGQVEKIKPVPEGDYNDIRCHDSNKISVHAALYSAINANNVNHLNNSLQPSF